MQVIQILRNRFGLPVLFLNFVRERVDTYLLNPVSIPLGAAWFFMAKKISGQKPEKMVFLRQYRMIKLLVIKLTMIYIIINNPPPLVNYVFPLWNWNAGEFPLLDWKKGAIRQKILVRKLKKVNPLPQILADQNSCLQCGCHRMW